MTTNPDPSQRKKFPAIAIVVTLLAVLLLFYVIWRLDTAPGTDDAYVDADIIAVVPEVSGKIVDLPVEDNQAVKKGDLLFQIDPRPYQHSLDRARAMLVQLDRARAMLVQLDREIELAQRRVNAEKLNADALRTAVDRARAAAEQATETLERMEPLLPEGYVSPEAVDQARTAQRSTQAELDSLLLRVKEAEAAVGSVQALVAQRAVVEVEIATAELHLEYTTVRAPFDGRVVALDTSVGQFASALKPVFTLIDTERWFVVANFREGDLTNIRPGTPGTVYLLANTGRKFQGTVDSIGYGVHPDDGGSTIGGLPMVKRTINWVRVTQRFPVKIRIEDPDPELFRIGASAVVTLHPGRGSRDTE